MYSERGYDDDDELTKAQRRKWKLALDVKREITYTAYVDNLEAAVKILTATKLVKLGDDAKENRKRVFVTS